MYDYLTVDTMNYYLEEGIVPCAGLSNEELIDGESNLQNLISKVGRLRAEAKIRNRQPLPVLYIKADKRFCYFILHTVDIVLQEANVGRICFIDSLDSFQEQTTKINFKVAGKHFRNDMQTFASSFDGSSSINLDAEEVYLEWWPDPVPKEVFTQSVDTKPGFMVYDEEAFSLALDTTIYQDLRWEGLARDIVRHCQVLRKSKGYSVLDRIVCSYWCECADVINAVNRFKAYILEELLADSFELSEPGAESEKIQVDGMDMYVTVNVIRKNYGH